MPRPRTVRGHPAGAPVSALDTHVHQFVPGRTARTLLLLHGTGGDEHDLVPLGRMLDPAAALLSPRGNVLEHGAPRFFRRIAEGVFDQDDLARRTAELAAFLDAAAARYGFDRAHVVAVGYSNGANIAASLLLSRPRPFAAAVLLRAMTPFEPPAPPDLGGVAVRIASGRHDPIIRADDARRLAGLLGKAGAAVTHAWAEAGHELTSPEVDEARVWLAALPESPEP